MTNIYLMSIDEKDFGKYLETQMRRLNFEILVRKGYVPSRSIVWMPRRRPGDPLNKRIYERLDMRYHLREIGAKLEEGLTLPEGWLWHDTYECILIVDGHDQITCLLKRMFAYVDGCSKEADYREGFIYRLKSFVQNGSLKMRDEGLLYEGGDGC